MKVGELKRILADIDNDKLEVFVNSVGYNLEYSQEVLSGIYIVSATNIDKGLYLQVEG